MTNLTKDNIDNNKCGDWAKEQMKGIGHDHLDEK